MFFSLVCCNFLYSFTSFISDSDVDSKLHYQKPACKSDFMFHSSSWWFRYFREDIVQIFDTMILLKSRIIPQFLMLMQILYIHATFWCINFLLFWHEGIFMVLIMLFVCYMKIKSTIFFITKKYLVNMILCFSCFLFDGITQSYCEITNHTVNVFAHATRD